MTAVTYGTFSMVLDHRTKNNQVQVQIKWDNSNITWEPLNSLRKDNPVTLAKFTYGKGITNKCRWKWSRKFNKQLQKLLQILCINAGQKAVAKHAAKYKFRVQIPKHPMHTLKLDRLNGNQLHKFNTFLVYIKGDIDLKDYTAHWYSWSLMSNLMDNINVVMWQMAPSQTNSEMKSTVVW